MVRSILARAIRATLAAGSLGLAVHASATTLTVNTQADTAPVADANCTLREAIANANAHANTFPECGGAGTGTDTIQFSPGISSIVLALGSELPLTDSTITIDGGATGVTVDGNNTSRVFSIAAGSAATFKHLTIQHGRVTSTEGAGINNLGNLTLDNCTVQDNNGHYYGGGIRSYKGTLTATNTTVSGNSAPAGAGMFIQYGTANITGSHISGNSADLGGGIYQGDKPSTITISGSTLSGNTATKNGGGIHAEHTGMTVSDSVISGNSAGILGGGVVAYAPITISGTLFQNNFAGPYNYGGCMGGGLATVGNDGSTGSTIANSTFVGNYIKTSATATRGFGGGICNSATITLKNVTMSGNSAPYSPPGGYGGGGIYNEPSFGASSQGLVYLSNTIITNSGTAGNCGGQVAHVTFGGSTLGTFDQGGNIEDANTCGFTIAASSLPNTNPQLGALQNNGGPTNTMLPLASSAAIDKGIDAVCSAAPVNAVDQRGVTRPQGPHCDSGAVEAREFALGVAVSGSGLASAGASPAPVSGGISNCSSSGGSNCQAIYEEGGSVTLTGTPAAANYLSAWSGSGCADNGNATATVPMNSAHSCTATFGAMSILGGATPASPAYGDTVTLSATIGGNAPSGTITFSEGASTLCSATLNSGTASCQLSTLSAATHNVLASYPGDARNGSDSTSFQVTLSKQATSTSLQSSANPSNVGQSVTFTATVSGTAPTGNVTFKDGATAICSNVALSGASATCLTSTLIAGAHAITAAYAGDANHQASTSTALNQQVDKNVSATSISTACRTTFTENQSTALASVVTGTNPTGSVAFKDGATVFCGNAPLSGGNATCATPAVTVLGGGTVSVYHVTANYGGDAANSTSVSSALALTVLKAGDVAFRNDFETNPAGCPTH